VTQTDPFLPFELTVCGIDELHGHREAQVSHVLSILDPAWPVPEAFGSFGEHERLELRFHDIIDDQPGWQPPREEHVKAILAFGRDLMAEPARTRHLLVHCHMGISRSTAAMLLILVQARPDRSPGEAMAALRQIRKHAWPNLRMVELGDALLGRNGTIVAAAREHYAYALTKRPELGEEMLRLGRAREVKGG
jgi:predicted protein tyrosine phosphatase